VGSLCPAGEDMLAALVHQAVAGVDLPTRKFATSPADRLLGSIAWWAG
jgi:hypothetical protein